MFIKKKTLEALTSKAFTLGLEKGWMLHAEYENKRMGYITGRAEVDSALEEVGRILKGGK